mgnify:CR=1 FL=1|tara:strand:+ start:771 stop:1517 length:747 start_codon:yes stop_codon:yes gene_type:complete
MSKILEYETAAPEKEKETGKERRKIGNPAAAAFVAGQAMENLGKADKESARVALIDALMSDIVSKVEDCHEKPVADAYVIQDDVTSDDVKVNLTKPGVPKSPEDFGEFFNLDEFFPITSTNPEFHWNRLPENIQGLVKNVLTLVDVAAGGSEPHVKLLEKLAAATEKLPDGKKAGVVSVKVVRSPKRNGETLDGPAYLKEIASLGPDDREKFIQKFSLPISLTTSKATKARAANQLSNSRVKHTEDVL